MFTESVRDKIKKELGPEKGRSMVEVNKRVSALWREVSKKQKDEWSAKAKEASTGDANKEEETAPLPPGWYKAYFLSPKDPNKKTISYYTWERDDASDGPDGQTFVAIISQKRPYVSSKRSAKESI